MVRQCPILVGKCPMITVISSTAVVSNVKFCSSQARVCARSGAWKNISKPEISVRFGRNVDLMQSPTAAIEQSAYVVCA